MKRHLSIFLLLFLSVSVYSKSIISIKTSVNSKVEVKDIFERVRSHDFHPLDDDNAMTMDRHLNVAGIDDLDDDDWRVRLLAERDLVRARTADVADAERIRVGLTDQSPHVRQISAMALGILRGGWFLSGFSQIGVRYAMVNSMI